MGFLADFHFTGNGGVYQKALDLRYRDSGVLAVCAEITGRRKNGIIGREWGKPDFEAIVFPLGVW